MATWASPSLSFCFLLSSLSKHTHRVERGHVTVLTSEGRQRNELVCGLWIKLLLRLRVPQSPLALFYSPIRSSPPPPWVCFAPTFASTHHSFIWFCSLFSPVASPPAAAASNLVERDRFLCDGLLNSLASKWGKLPVFSLCACLPSFDHRLRMQVKLEKGGVYVMHLWRREVVNCLCLKAFLSFSYIFWATSASCIHKNAVQCAWALKEGALWKTSFLSLTTNSHICVQSLYRKWVHDRGEEEGEWEQYRGRSAVVMCSATWLFLLKRC